MSDDTLIAAARTRDAAGQRAFSSLVTRYQAWLIGFLTSLLGSRSDAEDVAQEAFVRAFLALPRFRAGSSFQAWLRVIATRLAYNRIRNNATRANYRTAFGSLQRLVSSNGDRVALREILSLTLEKLAYPYREVLILHHVEELSVKEVAATLAIGLSAAKMRLSRARAEFVETYNRAIQHHV